jgi:hypothetical protein
MGVAHSSSKMRYGIDWDLQIASPNRAILHWNKNKHLRKHINGLPNRAILHWNKNKRLRKHINEMPN